MSFLICSDCRVKIELGRQSIITELERGTRSGERFSYRPICMILCIVCHESRERKNRREKDKFDEECRRRICKVLSQW